MHLITFGATTMYVAAVLFIATFIRTTFGFGEALVAVPLLALRMPIAVATPLAVAVSAIVAAVAVARDWRDIDMDNAAWLVGAALVGLPFGLLLLKYGNDRLVHLLLGALIIAVAMHALVATVRPRLNGRHRGWLLGAGIFSGVLGGAYGMNGPPLAIYGAYRGWSPAEFRATLQGYFLVASVAGLVGYFWLGMWTQAVTLNFVWSLPAVLLAIIVARRAMRHIDASRFFRVVLLALTAIGCVLIAEGLFQ